MYAVYYILGGMFYSKRSPYSGLTPLMDYSGIIPLDPTGTVIKTNQDLYEKAIAIKAWNIDYRKGEVELYGEGWRLFGLSEKEWEKRWMKQKPEKNGVKGSGRSWGKDVAPTLGYKKCWKMVFFIG